MQAAPPQRLFQGVDPGNGEMKVLINLSPNRFHHSL
jgi:hypothetical protein